MIHAGKIMAYPWRRICHKSRSLLFVLPVFWEWPVHTLTVIMQEAMVLHVVPPECQTRMDSTCRVPPWSFTRHSCQGVSRRDTKTMLVPEVGAPVSPLQDIRVTILAGKEKRLISLKWRRPKLDLRRFRRLVLGYRLQVRNVFTPPEQDAPSISL